jgi:hypothetical protein
VVEVVEEMMVMVVLNQFHNQLEVLVVEVMEDIILVQQVKMEQPTLVGVVVPQEQQVQQVTQLVHQALEVKES